MQSAQLEQRRSAPDTADDDAPSPVAFEEATRLPARSYCGGPTKDHILESGGSGVALLDYDGDGLLDVYLVTASELGPGRERIPHRNALYRNLGGWRFEDVSKRAGVDAAAWGNGGRSGPMLERPRRSPLLGLADEGMFSGTAPHRNTASTPRW